MKLYTLLVVMGLLVGCSGAPDGSQPTVDEAVPQSAYGSIGVVQGGGQGLCDTRVAHGTVPVLCNPNVVDHGDPAPDHGMPTDVMHIREIIQKTSER